MLEQELLESLRQEEEFILKEYEAVRHFEEEELRSAIEGYYGSSGDASYSGHGDIHSVVPCM